MNFFALDKMDLTVFSNEVKPNVFDLNWNQTSDEKSTDFFVTRFDKVADKFISENFKKNIIIYTHEPRYSVRMKAHTITNGNNVFSINPYTAGQYFDDFAYFPWATKMVKKLLSPVKKEDLKNKKNSILLSRGGGDVAVYRNGIDLDLCSLRNRIGLQGTSHEFVDVFGKNWPAGISLESSGLGNSNWIERKLELISGYKINFCPENTKITNYCTEKLWHAIVGGCLPVYCGSDSVLQYFPKDSIVVINRETELSTTFNQLSAMSNDELASRINKCQAVLNLFIGAFSHRQHHSQRLNFLRSFVTKNVE